MALDKGDLGQTGDMAWSVEGNSWTEEYVGSGGYQNREGPQSSGRCGWVLRGWRSRHLNSPPQNPQGMVRNGSPQLHLDPRPREASSLRWGLGVAFAGFPGDTKQEALGPAW